MTSAAVGSLLVGAPAAGLLAMSGGELAGIVGYVLLVVVGIRLGIRWSAEALETAAPPVPAPGSAPAPRG
jgi:hypothetical protein